MNAQQPVRLAGSKKDKTDYQAELLTNRLTKRFRHLRKFARRIHTDAFRLYDRDIPEIPLAIDVYCVRQDGAASAGDPQHETAVVMSLYQRPYEKPQREEEAWLAAMRSAVCTSIGAAEERVFLKMRKRQEGSAQYEKLAARRVMAEAQEGGLRFIVNLSDYIDTGLFLDARRVRRLVHESCAGKSVLNLFCYTGSFSAAASLGGALSVDSVDISPVYLDWARKNCALNNCPEKTLRFIRADVREFLQDAVAEANAEANAKKLRWDYLILDPPAFSNSKKMEGFFDIKRDHSELISRCLSLLNPNGVLLFGAKAKGFNLETQPASAEVSAEAVSVTDISPKMQDEDYIGKKTGKWYVFKKL